MSDVGGALSAFKEVLVGASAAYFNHQATINALAGMFKVKTKDTELYETGALTRKDRKRLKKIFTEEEKDLITSVGDITITQW